MTDTAVLFLVFNRPDTTRKVFESIRVARPSRLYIAADGPREGRAGESEVCDEVRAIATRVDWSCTVRTLFRDKNLGCRRAVSSAIDWFFDQEPEGIILEDDCLPDPTFFNFCSEMLARYRDDTRVSMISGTNYLFGRGGAEYSYFFSRYFAIWGWATWKRAWSHYDSAMERWPEQRTSGAIRSLIDNPLIRRSYAIMFDQAYTNELDTWDLAWAYSCLFRDTFAIVPTVNLVSNIGLDGAHAIGEQSPFHFMPTSSLGEMKHPPSVALDPRLDGVTMKNTGMSRFRLRVVLASMAKDVLGISRRRLRSARRADVVGGVR